MHRKLFRTFIVTLATVASLSASDTLVFAIRVDDIMSRNTTYLPRSIKPFEQAVNSRGGKVTWAVIPHRLIESQNLDGSLAQELIESVQNGNEVCQHGYNHICPLCGSTGHEFFCTAQNYHFSYDLQDSLIKAGQAILNEKLGLQPRLFVPPAHARDDVTSQVLTANGFKYLSVNAPYKEIIAPGLFNIGVMTEYTWSMTSSVYRSKLNEALSAIKTTGETLGYYAILLHDYFIRLGYENGIVIQWIGELLDSLNVRYGARIKYVTLSEAARYFSGDEAKVTLAGNTILNFHLAQNYPNPFNAGTLIGYELFTPATVSLEVINLRGEVVATLQQGFQNSGRYQVRWDGGDLPTGIYFYRLRSGNQHLVRKAIYLR